MLAKTNAYKWRNGCKEKKFLQNKNANRKEILTDKEMLRKKTYKQTNAYRKETLTNKERVIKTNGYKQRNTCKK